nr:MAG TPA: hypothetical protein [Caudoviricetes sp.]
MQCLLKLVDLQAIPKNTKQELECLKKMLEYLSFVVKKPA